MPVRVNTPISVRSNSWVELRAPNGDVLTQTYVRAGESYIVPAGIAYRITEAPSSRPKQHVLVRPAG